MTQKETEAQKVTREKKEAEEVKKKAREAREKCRDEKKPTDEQFHRWICQGMLNDHGIVVEDLITNAGEFKMYYNAGMVK